MGRFYFSAKIQQEYSDQIYKKAIDFGIPKENIVVSSKGCEFLCCCIYIKFESLNNYNDFCKLQLPGIIETWS